MTVDVRKLLRVIDVSRWQHRIDWAVTSKNISAAMIKIGGSDDGFYMDGYAQRNLIEARSHKVPIGVYYFLGGAHSMEEEARHIINLINELGGLKAGEPFCLDWERRRAGIDEVGYLTGIVERLTKHGFPPPVIYMNEHYLKTNKWDNLVRRNCPLWVASWGDNDANPEQWEVPDAQEFGQWWLWQFSSTGNIPGISGKVDFNLLRGKIDTFRGVGLGFGLKTNGTPIAIPVPSDPTAKSEYTVVSGDNLTTIARKYGKSWRDLYALNRDLIANPNRIFVGQKLRIWGTPGKRTEHTTPVQPRKPGLPVTHSNPPLPTSTEVNKLKGYHVVTKGEHLSMIASRYGTTWREIYKINRDTIGNNPNLIIPGQKLRIP